MNIFGKVNSYSPAGALFGRKKQRKAKKFAQRNRAKKIKNWAYGNTKGFSHL